MYAGRGIGCKIYSAIGSEICFTNSNVAVKLMSHIIVSN